MRLGWGRARFRNCPGRAAQDDTFACSDRGRKEAWNRRYGSVFPNCRICRNAGGRKSRGCPSLRRMPRGNRRRPGADRTGAKGPRFFGYGARCTVFFGENGNRCELERLTKTGGSCRNNKKRDALALPFLRMERLSRFLLPFCVRSLIVADVSPVAESKGFAE